MPTTIKEINGLLINLEVGGNHVLYIMLTDDGSINRKGNGNADCTDHDLYIGITKDHLFEKLKPFITEDMNDFFGKTFDVPEKDGGLCDLKIVLKNAEIETGVQFLYGEFSQGPPLPFRNLVMEAVALTDHWHRQQKKMAFNDTSKRKPWWKFW